MAVTQTDVNSFKADCGLHIGEFGRKLENHRAGWRIAIQDQGSAYEEAFDHFQDILKLQEEYNKMADAVLFSLLSIVSAGGLSCLSSMGGFTIKVPEIKIGYRVKVMTSRDIFSTREIINNLGHFEVSDFLKWNVSPYNDLIVNTAEDLMQATVGKACDLAAAGTPKHTEKTKDIPSPFSYKGESLKIIDQFQISINNYINDISAGVRAVNVKSLADSKITAENIKDDLDNWTNAISGDATLAPPVNGIPDKGEMALELEKGMWAAWALGLNDTQFRTPHENLPQVNYPPKAFGNAVLNRITGPKDLNVKLGHHGNSADYATWLKFKDWAKNWVPVKRFPSDAAQSAMRSFNFPMRSA